MTAIEMFAEKKNGSNESLADTHALTGLKS